MEWDGWVHPLSRLAFMSFSTLSLIMSNFERRLCMTLRVSLFNSIPQNRPLQTLQDLATALQSQRITAVLISLSQLILVPKATLINRRMLVTTNRNLLGRTLCG